MASSPWRAALSYPAQRHRGRASPQLRLQPSDAQPSAAEALQPQAHPSVSSFSGERLALEDVLTEGGPGPGGDMLGQPVQTAPSLWRCHWRNPSYHHPVLLLAPALLLVNPCLLRDLPTARHFAEPHFHLLRLGEH